MSAPRFPLRRGAVLVSVLALLGAACSAADAPADTAADRAAGASAEVTQASGEARSFPPAPPTPDGPLDPAHVQTIEDMLRFVDAGISAGLVMQFEQNPDPRVLWVLADWLRFTQGTPLGAAMLATSSTIADVEFDPGRPWGDLTDHLLAWDLAAPPDYRGYKAGLYSELDERWDFVFADGEADIDYRILNWGGVLIDDRELGDPEACVRGCIPSLDDPALTDAAGGDWYPDDAVVFGVEIGDQAVAFPRNIMEVHEMVNMTIGGRRIGMPYCTLCGAAQVFFTDEVVGVERPPVLRTSGLLSRSNKVMYDLDSQSVFDTFTGVAVSGPLRAAGVVLAQATVVTTTWADWKTSHPDTAIVAEDGGIGRTYELDPLQGRDDDGPIFPIGQVDPRLPVQEPVVGVELPDGSFVAFPADAARATLQNGEPVTFNGVALELDGEGLRARIGSEPIASHQAFWFAWSQFHPETELWLP